MEALLEFLAKRADEDRAQERMQDRRLRAAEIKLNGTMASIVLFIGAFGAKMSGLW